MTFCSGRLIKRRSGTTLNCQAADHQASNQKREEEKPSSVTSFKRRKEKDEEDEEIVLGLQRIGRR
jgi:hypothetical protein